jgi:hypothetical protein
MVVGVPWLGVWISQRIVQDGKALKACLAAAPVWGSLN